jgi:YVTN family beta-propeller protein
MDVSGGHGGAMKGSLIVLDMQTGTVKASKSLSAMNHNGVFSPDGKEIWTALASEPAKVQIYDMGLATLMKEIPVGNQPTEVTFSKEGQYAFVTNSGSGTVTVIDVSTKTVKTTIPVGETPVGAWMGVDGRMYVNNEQSQTVSVIDPTSLTVVQTVPLGFMPGSVATPTAVDEFWVSDPDGAKVHYYRRSDGSHLGVINVGAGAHAIAFNASGTTGYVTNQLANTVSVMDVAAHTVTKTIKVGIKPSGLVWRAKS